MTKVDWLIRPSGQCGQPSIPCSGHITSSFNLPQLKQPTGAACHFRSNPEVRHPVRRLAQVTQRWKQRCRSTAKTTIFIEPREVDENDVGSNFPLGKTNSRLSPRRVFPSPMDRVISDCRGFMTLVTATAYTYPSRSGSLTRTTVPEVARWMKRRCDGTAMRDESIRFTEALYSEREKPVLHSTRFEMKGKVLHQIVNLYGSNQCERRTPVCLYLLSLSTVRFCIYLRIFFNL